MALFPCHSNRNLKDMCKLPSASLSVWIKSNELLAHLCLCNLSPLLWYSISPLRSSFHNPGSMQWSPYLLRLSLQFILSYPVQCHSVSPLTVRGSHSEISCCFVCQTPYKQVLSSRGLGAMGLLEHLSLLNSPCRQLFVLITQFQHLLPLGSLHRHSFPSPLPLGGC